MQYCRWEYGVLNREIEACHCICMLEVREGTKHGCFEPVCWDFVLISMAEVVLNILCDQRVGAIICYDRGKAEKVADDNPLPPHAPNKRPT